MRSQSNHIYPDMNRMQLMSISGQKIPVVPVPYYFTTRLTTQPHSLRVDVG